MDKENFFNAATAFVTFGNEKVTAGPVRQDGFKSFPLLAIYYHEKILSNCIQNLGKSVTIFVNYQINPHKSATDILIYAEVAKFC